MIRSPTTTILAALLVACGPDGEAPAVDSGATAPSSGLSPGPSDRPDRPDDASGTDTATASTPTDTAQEVLAMNGFSFVEPQLAGMPLPYGSDFEFLAQQSVDLLVGLRMSAIDPDELSPWGIDYLHLPIEDFHPPTLDQQLAFVAAVDERLQSGDTGGVHCTAGLGRTGTMLATWFVHRGMGPREAIDHVRALRPGSIETSEQEEAVVHFASSTR